MHDADKQYLADHYYDFLTIALRLLGDEEEARDAVQEALASTMAMPWVRDAYRYCCRTLRNYCRDRFKERYIVAEPSELIADEGSDLQYKRRLELLIRLKGKLPTETVMLLDMRFVKGMTLKEVAATTGKTETWVRKKMTKTLHQLKEDIIYEESKQEEI